jgi:hypothetical protein
MANGNSKAAPIIGLFIVLVAVVAVLVWLHQPPRPPEKLDLPPEALAEASPAQVTPNLDINVYIDGSKSIEHFLHMPATKGAQPANGSAAAPAPGKNYLQDLLDRLTSTMSSESLWSGHKLHFWRFGGNCPVLLSDQQKVAAMSREPGNSFPENETKIDVPYRDDLTASCPDRGKLQGATTPAGVVPPPHPELKIVITDLYVSDLHMADLGGVIAQKYLDKSVKGSNAVSILAIRNPFYGRAEDLPAHSVGKPVATSMPFYVILSGPVPDVQFATRLLIDQANLIDAFSDGKAKLIYFSPDQNRFLPDQPKVNGERKQFHIFQRNYQGTNIPFYTLAKGKLIVQWPEPPEDAWATSKAQWKKEWSISPGTTDYTVKPGVMTYGLKKGSENPPHEDSKIVSFVTPCIAEGQSGQTCITIDRTGLKRGTTYRFRVDLQKAPSDNFRSRAEAMRNWTIDLQDAETISKSPDGHFASISGSDERSPGRTPELAQFLTNLQGETFPDASVRIANHHYIYVQAN